MGRPKVPASQKKRKVTITPAPEVLEYIDANVGLGKPFKDRTHAFEFAVAKLMQDASHSPKPASARGKGGKERPT